ncbi:MAG: hypothetical protein ABSE80_07095 [Halobacteriota archaeon]|jgi:hypothetical protein
MNNDCLEVDELILEIADYKNDYVDMAAEKLLRKSSTSWEAYNTCETARTMAGHPTVHVSSCDGSSKKYRCDCSRAANTGGHLNNRQREA